MNATYKPETLIVRRDGQLEDDYYDTIYAGRRKAVFQAAGREALEVMGQPIRNFRLNMLALLSNEA